MGPGCCIVRSCSARAGEQWADVLPRLIGVPLTLNLTGIIDAPCLLGSPWPATVRRELNEASRAERRGDFVAAVAFYTQAESAARKAAESTNHNGLLGASAIEVNAKLASLSLARASAMEQCGRVGEAFKAYEAAFDRLSVNPAVQDKMRSVALAQKLGDLAASGVVALLSGNAKRVENMDALAEKYYAYVVSTMMPLALPPSIHGARITASSGGQGIGAQGPEPPVSTGAPLDDSIDVSAYTTDAKWQAPIQSAFAPLKQLDLPVWAQNANLSQGIESLASFYATRGRPERAAQLYNHALSLIRAPGAASEIPSAPAALLPFPAHLAQKDTAKLSTEASCHAGVLHYKLTNALLSAAERSWQEQGKTPAEAQTRQSELRKRAMASAREGLALIRATEADLGVPNAPDPVTAIGRGAVAVLPSALPPAAPAHTITAEQDECKLAEAGLLFALGRSVAATEGATKQSADLYAAAAKAAWPLAAHMPLTKEHVVSLRPPQEPVSHATREAANELLADIGAQAK